MVMIRGCNDEGWAVRNCHQSREGPGKAKWYHLLKMVLVECCKRDQYNTQGITKTPLPETATEVQPGSLLRVLCTISTVHLLSFHVSCTITLPPSLRVSEVAETTQRKDAC